MPTIMHKEELVAQNESHTGVRYLTGLQLKLPVESHII